MVEVFHADNPQPYTLKQLEKLAQKKGVNTQTLKDVLSEMVSDGQVDLDKIGSTNWYWSFPNREQNALKTQLAKFEKEIQAVNADVAAAETQKKTLQQDRIPSKERTEKLKLLNSLRNDERELNLQLENLRENDPEKIQKMIELSDLCLAAANKWTDNTFQLTSFLKKKYSKNSKEAFHILRIKDDFDYVEEYKPSSKKPRK